MYTDIAENMKQAPGTDNGKVLFDEVEETMYGALIYKCDKKFNVDIGIEKLTKGLLSVFDLDISKEGHDPYCPLNSVGTLRKIAKK